MSSTQRPAANVDIYPLLPIQQAMLSHSLLNEGHNLYVESIILTVRGALDVGRWTAAVNAVAEQTPALRTVFLWEGVNRPVQIAEPSAFVPTEVLDCNGYTFEDVRNEITRYVRRQSLIGFDLRRSPLFRQAIFRADGAQTTIVWTHHHIILDGWSTCLLVNSVLDRYSQSGTIENPTSSAPRFGDYVRWFLSSRSTADEEFWRRELAGIDSRTDVPLQRRAGVSTDGLEMKELVARLPAADNQFLKSWASSNQLTMNTIVQGAWGLLLSRVLGKTDVVSGITVSGRMHLFAHVDAIVGLLIDTLPLRMQITGAHVVVDWLRGLQSRIQRLQSVKPLSYAELARFTNISNHNTMFPLFETSVVFEDYEAIISVPAQNRASLKVEHFEFTENTGTPLILYVKSGDALTIRAVYDGRAYLGASVKSLLDAFLNILRNFSSGTVTLGNVALTRMAALSADVSRRDDPDVMDLFERCAENLPERNAIISNERTVTYSQLFSYVGRIAEQLCALGIGPEDVVAISLPKSCDLVACLLAVLKCGAAYWLVDSNEGNARREALFAELTPRLMIADEHTPSTPLCMNISVRELLWLEESSGISECDSVIGESLAYVAATSGTSGVPKLVGVTRANLASAIGAWEADYRLTERSRVHLQIASPTFDVFTGDVVRALCTGASLVLCAAEVRSMPSALFETMVKYNVDCAEFVWPLCEKLIEYLERTDKRLSSLKLLILGSDKLRNEDVRRIQRVFSRTTLVVNSYGTTETTIDSSFFVVPSAYTPKGSGSVPIGRAFVNARLYLVDAELQSLPTEVVGELCIGGSGVGRGYLGRPGLTAEKYRPDPFSALPGARMYATGDLAVVHEAGTFEYIGRLDRQVKVRGVRVELEEIENVLRRYHAVRQAAAIAVSDPVDGRASVVAFVVSTDATNRSAAELQKFLLSYLPTTYFPLESIYVDTLPINTSGKVDMAALAAEYARQKNTTSLTQPHLENQSSELSGLERTIGEVWCEVLKRTAIQRQDNFFELGGDSILSIQVISRLRKRGLFITARQFLGAQTIAAQAQSVEHALVEQLGMEGSSTCGPLTPAQGWFFEQEFKDLNRWSMIAWVSSTEEIDAEMLRKAIAGVVAQHEALRVTFRCENGIWIQTVDPKWMALRDSLVEYFDEPVFNERARHRVERICEDGLSISTGPLVKCVIIRDDRACTRFAIAIHHLVIDAVSWAIFLDDLWENYEEVRRTGACSTRSAVSALAWARRLGAHAKYSLGSEVSCAWSAYFSERPTGFSLAGLFEGAGENGLPRRFQVSLAKEETTEILEWLKQRPNLSVEQFVLRCVARAILAVTGETSVWIDLERHGRVSPFDDFDVSRTIGWLTAVVPTRVDLKAGASVSSELEAMRASFNSVPSTDLSFGLLRYLSDAPSTVELMRALPRREVSFSYFGAAGDAVKAGEFRLDEVSLSAWRPGGERPYLIDVYAAIRQDCLELTWLFAGLFDLPVIHNKMSEACRRALVDIRDDTTRRDVSVTRGHGGTNFNEQELEVVLRKLAM